MATVKTEQVPTKALNTEREPQGNNRMVGDADKSMGGVAINDAILVIVLAWVIVFALTLSLREFING